MEDRHGLRSMIWTSQLPVAKWHDLLGDPTIADALWVRLFALPGHERLVRREPTTSPVRYVPIPGLRYGGDRLPRDANLASEMVPGHLLPFAA